MGQKVAINRGGVLARFYFFKGGALLEEASAFKKYFEPGPRPARVAINQRGFINQELTLNPNIEGAVPFEQISGLRPRTIFQPASVGHPGSC